MKKIIAMLLTLVMCLSLCACGGNDVPKATEVPTEITTAPTEEEVIPPTVEEPTAEATQPTEDTQPTEEEVEALYTPYIGKWVCSDDYYVIVNEDGSIVYNDVEYMPEYIVYGDGVAAVLYDAPYTYRGGTEIYTGKGCVFVWGLTERFGEGVMVGDHDGRHFILQSE